MGFVCMSIMVLYLSQYADSWVFVVIIESS